MTGAIFEVSDLGYKIIIVPVDIRDHSYLCIGKVVSGNLFSAFRADSMGKVGFRMVNYILFHLNPLAVGSYLLAPGADRQEALQELDPPEQLAGKEYDQSAENEGGDGLGQTFRIVDGGRFGSKEVMGDVQNLIQPQPDDDQAEPDKFTDDYSTG
jgi:hypothetical protein